MPDENERKALSKIKAYLDAGHSFDAIRQAGWASWIDHLETKGYDLRTGRLAVEPSIEKPPLPPRSSDSPESKSDLPQRQRRPWYTHRLVIGIAAIILGFLVVGGAVILWALGSDDDGTGSGSTSFVQATTSPSASRDTVGLRERLSVDDHPDVVVLAFQRSQNPDDLAAEFFTFELDPGEEFLILTVRVINDTEMPDGVDPFTDFSLRSRGESLSGALTFLLGSGGELDAEVLPPGAEETGTVAWSIRQGFDQLELVYSPASRDYYVWLEGQPEDPTAEEVTVLKADDEEKIRGVMDELAKALADEDWSRGYDRLAPSDRETCLRGQFLAQTNIAIEFAKGFIGEEAWEAIRDDAADGFEILSIEVAGDSAHVSYLENQDEGTDLIREDGEWWWHDDEACDFSFD